MQQEACRRKAALLLNITDLNCCAGLLTRHSDLLTTFQSCIFMLPGEPCRNTGLGVKRSLAAGYILYLWRLRVTGQISVCSAEAGAQMKRWRIGSNTDHRVWHKSWEVRASSSARCHLKETKDQDVTFFYFFHHVHKAVCIFFHPLAVVSLDVFIIHESKTEIQSEPFYYANIFFLSRRFCPSKYLRRISMLLLSTICIVWWYKRLLR